MAKRDEDLFQRLRRAGVRKPNAKALSELTDDAGKKAAATGHKAVSELRSLIEEIEKRLPVPKFVAQNHDEPAPVSAASRPVTKPRAKPTTTKPTAAKPTTAKTTSAPRARRAAAPVTQAAPKATRKAAPKASSSPAPRGENKAKILAALNGGPRTASQVSEETGISTTTVSSALNRLSKTGEVSKASRGYALPR